MISAEAFAGGSKAATLAAERQMSARHERVGVYDPSGSSYPVRLSDARQHREGALAHVIVNTGAANLTVRVTSGEYLTEVPPDSAVEFWVVDNSTADGTWKLSRSFTATLGTPI